MRQKPKEFGLGVRQVQAAPVDTFSPEVVMKPQAARGGAVGSALSGLSQTLAGMANQNSQFDEKTLEPLAQAVHALRQEKPGISDEAIAKNVSESGLTSARVLKKIRARGGFDAFTDMGFRLTYDELEGVDAAVRAETDMATIDATVESYIAGAGINDDPAEIMANVEAMYQEVLKPHVKGLSAFGLGAFAPRVDRSVRNRVSKAYGKAQRTVEQNAASLVVTEFQGAFDAWFNGSYDGDELESAMVGIWKNRSGPLNPLDIPPLAQSTIQAGRAYLSSARNVLNPANPEDAVEIQEFIQGIEDSFPPDVLDDNPDVRTDLQKLRADFTATERQLKAFGEEDDMDSRMKQDEIDLLAVHAGDVFGIAGRNDSKGLTKAADMAYEMLQRVPSMSEAEKAKQARAIGLEDPNNLEQALYGLYNRWDKQAYVSQSKSREDARHAQTVEGWAHTASVREKQENEKRDVDSYADMGARLGLAEGLQEIKAEWNAAASEREQLPLYMQETLHKQFTNLVNNPQGFNNLMAASKNAQGILVAKMLESAPVEDVGTYENPKVVSSVTESQRISMADIVQQEAYALASEFLEDDEFSTLIANPAHYSERFSANLEGRVRERLRDEALYGEGAPFPSYATQIGSVDPVGIVNDGDVLSGENIVDYASEMAVRHFDGNAAMQGVFVNNVKGAYEAIRSYPDTVFSVVSNGVIGSAGAPGRRALDDLVRSTRGIVDLYGDGSNLTDSAAAQDAWSSMVRNSATMSIHGGQASEGLDMMIQELENVTGEGAKETHAKKLEHLKTLRDMTENVSLSTSGKKELMTIKLSEFQPGGEYDGILDENQAINPNFRKSITQKDGRVRIINRATVVNTVREHLRKHGGYPDPSDSLVREFILRQAYKFPTTDT